MECEILRKYRELQEKYAAKCKELDETRLKLENAEKTVIRQMPDRDWDE